MGLSQVLWSLGENRMLSPGKLLRETELEDTLHQNIELLDPNWLTIGRQVGTANGKYLDLLCMDRDGNLIVVELKKDLTPREVTAQVIEYASYMAEKKPEDIAALSELCPKTPPSPKHPGHGLPNEIRRRLGRGADQPKGQNGHRRRENGRRHRAHHSIPAENV